MLEMRNLSKVFTQGRVLRRKCTVVDGANLSIGRGETVGLVGPSGAGKSTLGKLAVRLLEPTGGRLTFEGKDITHATGRCLRRLRAKMQIVFQDPQSSLHPKMKIDDLLKEPLRLHNLVPGSRERDTVAAMLARLALNEDILDRYPAQISGGEKQRVVIARVMALKPGFVVLDEPTSMLDVSVQANILHLLMDLQRSSEMAYLLISHDMRIVSKFCRRMAVVEQGRIVEQGAVADILAHPRHPCTKRRIDATGLSRNRTTT
jgi:ABC-type glutathione transport system ATPase component